MIKSKKKYIYLKERKQNSKRKKRFKRMRKEKRKNDAGMLNSVSINNPEKYKCERLQENTHATYDVIFI